MEEKRSLGEVAEEIYARDSRYKPDAYEFLMHVLGFTQQKLKRQGHLTAKELLDGLRDFAIEQYGPMAKTVLNHWGLKRTEDIGNIVFNMIEKKMLSKTESDSLDDFKNVYDFQEAFGKVLDNITIYPETEL